jgi:hypothetical protein
MAFVFEGRGGLIDGSEGIGRDLAVLVAFGNGACKQLREKINLADSFGGSDPKLTRKKLKSETSWR